MPKQDKEVGHKCHNFAPQQAGNPLLESNKKPPIDNMLTVVFYLFVKYFN